MSDVRDELGERLRLFQSQNKLVEARAWNSARSLIWK